MSKLLTLEINTQGKDYIVGDIHGCFDLLQAGLDAINFNPAVDRLICVGDLVDRGAQNLKALDYLKKPWFFSVIGNHEILHIKGHFNNHLHNGLSWAIPYRRELNLISTRDQSKDAKRYGALVEAFEALPYVIELNTKNRLIAVVHAHVPLLIETWDEAKDKINSSSMMNSDFVWGRDLYAVDSGAYEHIKHYIEGIDVIFCGHTPQKKATWASNHLNIDTMLYAGAMLTVFNATDETLIEVMFKDNKVKQVNSEAFSITDQLI